MPVFRYGFHVYVGTPLAANQHSNMFTHLP